MKELKEKKQWVLCPLCGSKTRLQVFRETELKDFPLFCPKCRHESIINAKNFTIETKTNLTKADTITVTYSATATNDKKVDNVSTAKADNIDPIKAKQTVTPTPKKKSVIEKIASQTGDMNKVLPYLVIILVAGGSLVYYIRKRR